MILSLTYLSVFTCSNLISVCILHQITSSSGQGPVFFLTFMLCSAHSPVVVVKLLSCVRLLQPCGLQHTRLPCPSPIPRGRSNSCSSSWRCHPTISSSVIPFSICLQSFPASGSFLMSQFFASGGFSFSISPFNEHPGLISFRMDWFDLLASPVPRT